MKIRPGCAQHIGSRSEQQDSFAFSHMEDMALVKRAGILAVVADGMGGLAMGRESGATVVASVLGIHESSSASDSPNDILQQAVLTANTEVLTLARGADVEGDAGSTLVAVIVKDDKLCWASVGDSRIYLYRSGELVQLNTEQNYTAELMRRVAAGDISRDEALNNPERAGLTNFIGNPDLKPADTNLRPFPIVNGDWLILCSDGLFGTLDDDEIQDELYGNPNDACDRLVKKAITINKPHQDNVTVAILGCGDKDPVTVKTTKRGRVEVYQPLPVEKSKKPLVVGILATVLVFIGAFGLYFKSKNKPDPEKKNPPIMSQPSSSKGLKESSPQENKQDAPVPPKVQEPQKVNKSPEPTESPKTSDKQKETDKSETIKAIPKKEFKSI